MAMVIIPEGMIITMTLNGDVSPKMKKNNKVQVDRIKKSESFASGYSARVINIYKNPRYLDMGWFCEFGDTVKILEN